MFDDVTLVFLRPVIWFWISIGGVLGQLQFSHQLCFIICIDNWYINCNVVTPIVIKLLKHLALSYAANCIRVKKVNVMTAFSKWNLASVWKPFLYSFVNVSFEAMVFFVVKVTIEFSFYLQLYSFICYGWGTVPCYDFSILEITWFRKYEDFKNITFNLNILKISSSFYFIAQQLILWFQHEPKHHVT